MQLRSAMSGATAAAHEGACKLVKLPFVVNASAWASAAHVALRQPQVQRILVSLVTGMLLWHALCSSLLTAIALRALTDTESSAHGAVVGNASLAAGDTGALGCMTAQAA
jgi:hypothetical protein